MMGDNHLDALYRRTQRRLEVLHRHRREVANETAGERAGRQQARAYEVAHATTGGRVTPAILKWALDLVVADEHPDPPGDPVPPKAPGARAVLKPKSGQEGLW